MSKIIHKKRTKTFGHPWGWNYILCKFRDSYFGDALELAMNESSNRWCEVNCPECLARREDKIPVKENI